MALSLQMKSFIKIIKKSLDIVKLLYTPFSIAFILYFSYANRTLLARIFDVADIIFIVVASLIWCGLHLLAPITTKIIFAGLGYRINLKNLIAIHISRLPARYLPGGIWHTVGRYSDYLSLGTSKKHLTVLALIETFFPCFITLMVGGSFLWVTGEKGLISSIEGGLALSSFCILAITPIFIKLRFPELEIKNLISQYVGLTCFSVLFWLIASVSFLFYYLSVVIEINAMPLLNIAATYIFSWGVGYIAVFAPQGIGVFEVVAGKLMEIPMTLGGAVSFIAGFRIVVLIADMTCWVTYRLCFWNKDQTKGSGSR